MAATSLPCCARCAAQGHPHACTSRAQPRRGTRQTGRLRTTSGCCRPHERLKTPAVSGEAQSETRAGMWLHVCLTGRARSAQGLSRRENPLSYNSRAQPRRDTGHRVTPRTALASCELRSHHKAVGAAQSAM